MKPNAQLYRLSAFSADPMGGNPAGVWVGQSLPEPNEMQQIAAQVGYSETAFIAPLSGPDRQVRYFSPLAEVPFCGHATIAGGVQLGRLQGGGEYRFHTSAGEVPLRVYSTDSGYIASLTSVATRHEPAPETLVDEALNALRWHQQDLDPEIPPARAYAGAWHLVLAVSSLERLNDLDYDFEGLKAIMLRHDLTTLQLIWREHAGLIHSRNPFPVGGVVEDAATGAAAAALGGYLRDALLMATPGAFTISQGVAMGRPSQLEVTVPVSGGIEVSGTAVQLE